MSTQVPALKFDSTCTRLPTAKAFLMFCSPPQSGISANRVHNLQALNTEGCYLQVILGMSQIPSSPSCDTENQKERDQEKTKLIKLPTAQNAPLRRLIFEPINVIIRSLEVELSEAVHWKTDPKRESMNGTHLFHLMVWQEGHDIDGKLCRNELLWYESLPHISHKRKKVVGERCLLNFT